MVQRRASEAGLQLTIASAGDRTAAGEAYASATVVCAPYRDAVMSEPAHRAAAAGIPIVATEVDTLLELVEDGVTGYIVPIDDILGLARRLEVLLLGMKPFAATSGVRHGSVQKQSYRRPQQCRGSWRCGAGQRAAPHTPRSPSATPRRFRPMVPRLPRRLRARRSGNRARPGRTRASGHRPGAAQPRAPAARAPRRGRRGAACPETARRAADDRRRRCLGAALPAAPRPPIRRSDGTPDDARRGDRSRARCPPVTGLPRLRSARAPLPAGAPARRALAEPDYARSRCRSGDSTRAQSLGQTRS